MYTISWWTFSSAKNYLPDALSLYLCTAQIKLCPSYTPYEILAFFISGFC